MREPQVREHDITSGALAISAAVLLWLACNVDEEGKRLDGLEADIERMRKLVKRFRKEQLA